MTRIDGVDLEPVPGTTDWMGWGPAQYRYTVYVEKGISVKRGVFARKIDEILGDDRGWIRGGKVAFRRVEDGADTQVILATPDSVDKLCWPLHTEGKVSCNVGSKVVINLTRWRVGVPHWTEGIRAYRQMLVNHEWGHRIGKSHRYCGQHSTPGGPAPVMSQQTYGLQGCKENSWPLASEL